MKKVIGGLLVLLVSMLSATSHGAMIDYKGGQFDTSEAANSAINVVNESQGQIIDDDIYNGYYRFWPHGESMNKAVTLTWDNGVKNTSGDDIVFVMNRYSWVWGGTIGVEINGIFHNQFADFLIKENNNSATDPYAGIFAGGIDLSNFGLADNEIVHSLTFRAANLPSYGSGACTNAAEWGNCSDIDVMFAGALPPSVVAPDLPISEPGIAFLFLSGFAALASMKKRRV
ncbi:hypothetical protein NF212_09965 [Parasalinivibrio latis]|uniref:hypothetical protein n=1 Tax=Parasalinivibrio latis TaxID=2952610 RepID=UPI0030E412E5